MDLVPATVRINWYWPDEKLPKMLLPVYGMNVKVGVIPSMIWPGVIM